MQAADEARHRATPMARLSAPVEESHTDTRPRCTARPTKHYTGTTHELSPVDWFA